jgi:superfamily II DNA or RNA helicase
MTNYSEIRDKLYSNLRCYQKSAVDEILRLFDEGKINSILRQNHTGTGKSVEQNFLAVNWLAESDEHAYLFLIHREELLDNAADYFRDNEIPFTFIRQGFKTLYSKRAFLAGIDYFKNQKRLETFKKYLTDHKKKLFIIVDETHHVAAKSWSKILEFFPEAFRVGFSATPERLDGQGFDKIFQHLISGKSYQWYIDNHFLAPFKLHLPKQIEMSLTKGDSLDQQEDALTDEILGDAVKIWQEFTPGLKTFTFCPTISTSQKVADLYNDFGYREYGKQIAEHLDGTTDKKYRREALARFNLPSEHTESLMILTNVELFIEGVNVRSCQVTQHLRYTASEIYFDQMNGRSNRYLPGKVQHIIDHVGNTQKHGLPNRDRSYDLLGRNKREKEDKYKLFCQNCQTELANDYRILETNSGWFECPECGTDTLLPVAKMQTRKRKSSEYFISFEDCEFATLDVEHYTAMNNQALFGKLSKIKSNSKYLDEVANVSHASLELLVAACKYRGMFEASAISAWSRRLARSMWE